MSSLKIVIVGGVAGGASAAAKARRVNESAEITMFERGPYVSFANCGLPYYVGNTIVDRNDLLLQTPEKFWKRFRITVKIRHEVLSIHRPERTVAVKNLESGETFDVTYDKLILAPGAGAVVPEIPGIHARNIFTVKTVPDSDAIKQFLANHRAKRALVVGGGFIGLETAEALMNLGMTVTLVELAPQILPPFDKDMAMLMAVHLQEQGVNIIVGDAVTVFHTKDGLAEEAELESGTRLPCDLAILSIGVRPELKLAKDAGLAIGESGGIVVNEYQQTIDPNIYAAGDAVEIVHLVTGKPARIPLAGPANKQGRVAGANAAGGHLKFPGAIGTAIVESLGMMAAKTGLSEREAQSQGFNFFVSVTHPLDHADYYPGAEALHMKLIVEKTTGRLLGAQIIGEQGVDKRIDVLATAISARMTVEGLEHLDLAYAPQFSSAKGPVIMAGFVAANILRGEVQTMTGEELQKKLAAKEPLQLLDVRTQAEFHETHIPQAWLIPVDELRDHLDDLDQTKETIVYCRVGLRGYQACRILLQHGFQKVYNLTGGILSFNGKK
ncbi:FAD-dependent oxidoreductase [Candidatus Nitronereus thalassa]|uniref:FAD-dependent oxidoreductase n=1 Tax=Candidatus Nitronereus thalassa TaxID=3020898 RepID=A0ABU3K7K9_9BACT|nr:FAD-dependent oxidoreductase [Candidatus Nitronereus thalassa]MDT7042379.1 FAD-dependent oxidoreductase [Candidatus Nitronereus thalassa]